MRTTVRLPDDLMRELKRVAAESDRTMTQVIEDALRATLAPREAPERREIELTIVDGRGLRPGVDLDDSRALRDLMDGLD